METYDPAAITLIVAGQIIEGYMDGSFLEIERDEDTWTPFTGSGGENARTRNRNSTGKIVVRLMQTSSGNDILSALHNTDETTGIPPGPAMVKDNLGNTLLGGDACYVLKPAPVAFGKDYSGREWTIVVPKLGGTVGGAL